MKLITVNSATKTSTAGLLELSITADLEDGAGEQVLPFGYAPGDPYGLGPAVQAWMEAHPDFPVAAYVPVPEAETPEITDQQLLEQLKELVAELKKRGLV